MWSRRATQRACSPSSLFGRRLRKNQYSSAISIQHSAPIRNISTTNGPPTPNNSRDAPTKLMTLRLGTPLLDALGQEARALLVEDLHDAARHRREERVHEQQRDGDAEARDRRDHGLADAVR